MFVAKSGISPDNCAKLVKYVVDECKNLKFLGLMTIGAIGSSSQEGNKDFQVCHLYL